MTYLKNNLREAKYRFMINVSVEISLALSLISGVASLSAQFTPTYASKAQLTEVLTSFSTYKALISQQYMETGRWPDKSELGLSDNYSENLVKRIEFDGKGTINYFLNDRLPNLKDKIISFTATINNSQEWQNLIWTCGYAKTLQGYKILGHNITNIDPLLLPRACKI